MDKGFSITHLKEKCDILQTALVHFLSKSYMSSWLA